MERRRNPRRPKTPDREKPVSLWPLNFEDALGALTEEGTEGGKAESAEKKADTPDVEKDVEKQDEE